MILELAHRYGLTPKCVSRTNGGEFASGCPSCGFGDDRFRLWPKQGTSGRFWCRRCNVHGNSITFCRLFLGMSFAKAKDQVGISNISDNFNYNYPPRLPIRTPSRTWVSKAEEFIEGCHKRLIIDPAVLASLKAKYGLDLETIRLFRVGLNPEQRFHRRSEWGLLEEERKLWLCLPKGIVIPFFYDGKITKIKIRRSEWPEGNWPKYYEVPGSSDRMAMFGFFTNQVALILESELDAMTLCQEIGEFGTCIATGGVSKHPDADIFHWLKERKLILYSQDYDDVGKQNFRWWESAFTNVRRWFSETQKSPADSFVADGINIRDWFLAGIEHYSRKIS